MTHFIKHKNFKKKCILRPINSHPSINLRGTGKALMVLIAYREKKVGAKHRLLFYSIMYPCWGLVLVHTDLSTHKKNPIETNTSNAKQL